ncbi:SDR family oxidoreductase [Micromonospora cathayae]|uniref:SDR family NAD(P)-dependent oxidoreductase n=1 Tax=Micromonospora cathayae TaxID=3028804 RepID=A0ABY7ZKP9_9ACTN|nr:SDR family NAD(P)-dependent oxidoreductase [Micromonospora sp. HUAS 3]WDZ83570.1 SDR family NAD(P)-dependent oxidoreductase [Micromonospora sp. HUAS 3]
MADDARDRTPCDRVALVTGGAGGIGAAVARRLAASGRRVVVADLAVPAGEALAAEIGGVFVRTDVTSLDDNRAVVAAAARLGRLDVVHLNAGVSGGCGFGDEFAPDRYLRALSVNLNGVVFGVHAALPRLRGRGGTIVVTGSLAGLVGSAFDPVYATTKHAVIGLVRCLAPALAPDGIRINALCPTFVDTPFIDEARAGLRDRGLPVLTPDQVADAFGTVLDSPGSGQAWVLRPGVLQPFPFPPLPEASPAAAR